MFNAKVLKPRAAPRRAPHHGFSEPSLLQFLMASPAVAEWCWTRWHTAPSCPTRPSATPSCRGPICSAVKSITLPLNIRQVSATRGTHRGKLGWAGAGGSIGFRQMKTQCSGQRAGTSQVEEATTPKSLMLPLPFSLLECPAQLPSTSGDSRASANHSEPYLTTLSKMDMIEPNSCELL